MTDSVLLSGGGLTGQLHHVEGLGAAWAPLCHPGDPERSLFGDGGLNFEHIFNGTAADEALAWFTPRTDTHRIESKSDATAFVVHEAADSAWAAESRMTYTLSADAVDLQFRVRFHEERFPLGWIGLMWASYMRGTQDRRIHFYGTCDGEEGWTRFGDDTDDGFETGTVAAAGVEELPREEGAALLNVVEDPRKRFLHPVYYGLLEGGMAYTMMFDHAEAKRQTLHLLGYGNVRLNRHSLDAGCPKFLHQSVCAIRTSIVINNNICSVSCESSCYGLAYSFSPAGNQSVLAFQVHTD